MQFRTLRTLFILSLVALLATGCAHRRQKAFDYTAYKQSDPKSILVLPPLNSTPDIKATNSMLSFMTRPLAEAGYYVFPVAVMDETFKQNGLSTAGDIHAVPINKLQEIFGADAALYVNVTKYGSVYTVINSETVVAAEARLVDLKTGQLLWTGKASASSAEQQNNNGGGGIVGVLVSAAVKQVINSLTNESHRYAGVTSERLLATGHNGILYGPRSPQYGKGKGQQ
ncbi:DUF799 domain-containing protein [Chitinivorax tropicus]|nr:DUF799 domain-containing protein [Chitinivorax tropicus]